MTAVKKSGLSWFKPPAMIPWLLKPRRGCEMGLSRDLEVVMLSKEPMPLHPSDPCLRASPQSPSGDPRFLAVFVSGLPELVRVLLSTDRK